MISASKYHSYGNDFLILMADQLGACDYGGLAKAICHPHFGVGADGCVIVCRNSDSEYSVRILNQDGSETGMSGNGARCACAFLHHHGVTETPRISLHTRSGLKIYELIEGKADSWKYGSWMGEPLFAPPAIPFLAPTELQRVVEFPLEVRDERVSVTALSVGNPQCVVFVAELPPRDYFLKVGAGLECHPAFPQRTNVSFARVVDPDDLQILIYERGVGPTLSSGTGSCGAAVAAIATGRARSPVTVSTETGSQEVQWTPGQQIRLVGSTEFIADVQFHWRT